MQEVVNPCDVGTVLFIHLNFHNSNCQEIETRLLVEEIILIVVNVKGEGKSDLVWRKSKFE